jgi:4-hydroxybenzoate polyprenyltransferase
MVYQTVLLFQLEVPRSFFAFVFTGTFCAYNFHWLLTSLDHQHLSTKAAWSIAHRKLHLAAFLAGGLACLYFFWQLRDKTALIFIAGTLTFLYSAPKIPIPPFTWLKKIAVAKTVYLALSWTFVTSLMPLLFKHSQLTNLEIQYGVERFFYIYAICILFDFRDREADRRDGVRSMITDLNDQGINFLFYASVTVASALSCFYYPHFSFLGLLAMILPTLVLILLYPSSKKNFSDFRYYFILDGLMMASTPLLVLVKFAGL